MTDAVPASSLPLETRLQFETLLSDVSARLVKATPVDIDTEVTAALQRVLESSRAQQCGLIICDTEANTAHVSHAAYAPGVDAVPPSLNLVPLYPWTWEQVRNPATGSAVVNVIRVAELPPEANVDRASWDALDVKAAVVVRIDSGDVLRHILVLHWIELQRPRYELLLPRLRVLGEVMVSALERNRAMVKIAETQARLALAIASAGAGLFDLDAATGQIWATPETRVLYGFPADQEIGLTDLLIRVHPDDCERAFREFHEALTRGTSLHAEHRLVLPDGRIRWINMRGRHHGDDATDSRQRLLGVVVDVTDRKEAEESLTRANADLERLRDRLRAENVYLHQQVRVLQPGQIVGQSTAIRRVIDQARQVAATSSTVLLLGETGVGKERFAALIHELSPRRERPIVRVNCAAIPTTLIESELFGREKGAYTGALSRQAGRFELAHGSTIFLDEVGELPPEVQVKLLRVLQEKQIERLGSSRPVPVDVRIITATNRDLEKAVREGRFRDDLYYRLNVFPIRVPPLRERPEDVPLLVAEIVDELSATMNKQIDSIDEASMDAMREYGWPGNIRELRNVLERAMILATGRVLHVEIATPDASPAVQPSRRMQDVERQTILDVLQQTGWRIRGKNGAAAILGLKATTLEYRMAKLGISRP